MIVVPSGTFEMGSLETEERRGSDEGPRRTVVIAEPLAVGVYEVTFTEWDHCVSEGGCRGYRPDDSGWGRGRRPVMDVSWNDAKAYVAWLSERSGSRYRLATESEWEYFARAGTTSRYWWGDEVGVGMAWWVGSHGDNDRQTAPVGSFAPNPFGLYDVHGNVWEWVEDCWSENYGRASSNGVVQRHDPPCKRRVVRGGSWSTSSDHLRSANRSWKGPDYRGGAQGVDRGKGFRVVKDLP